MTCRQKSPPRRPAGASLASLASLVLASGAGHSLAQSSPLDQPLPPLTLPRVRYLDFNLEEEKSSQTGSGSKTTYLRTYLAPTVGIGWDYYLYHPDLMTYSLLAEPGYVWQQTGSGTSKSYERDFLLNGRFNATVLQLKPYASTIFANATHETHQYDFYNSVVQDSQNFGVNTGYRGGPLPFTLTFQKSLTDSTGLDYGSSSDRTSATFHTENERKIGNTDLSYQFENDVWNQSGATESTASTTHNLNLIDTENFGNRTLVSSLVYSHAEYTGSANDQLNLSLNYTVEHTPHLQSFYNYNLGEYGYVGGSSLQNTLRAGLQHQLYESLSSYLDVHGSSSGEDSSGSKVDTYAGGTTASLHYNKRLGTWGRLSLDESGSYDRTSQSSSGGTQLVPGESHTLPAYPNYVSLNQPQAINDGNFMVTTAGGLLLTEGVAPNTPGADYYVDRTTNPWRIQIDQLSLRVTSGDVILVTYDVQPNPSGNYSTLADGSQVRLELWDGLLDFYAQYNQTKNDASSPAFVLLDADQWRAGSDLNWKRMRLSSSYTENHSSLFSYNTFQLGENFQLLATRRSSLSLSFSQQWTHNLATGTAGSQTTDSTFYDYRLHYSLELYPGLYWSSEAGYQQQHGSNLKEDLIVGHTYLEWAAGRLKVNLGYEYDNDTELGSERVRNFFFLRLRRNF